MSFKVTVHVEETDGLDGEILSKSTVSRLIKDDSWVDNADEWASIMDTVVTLVYGRRLEFQIKAVDVDE